MVPKKNRTQPGITTYKESGIELNLRNDYHFRFKDIEHYKALSGEGLNEMDFCWWNREENVLYLLEIINKNQIKERGANYFFQYLYEKAIDSILMLAITWIPTVCGRGMRDDISHFCPSFPNFCKISINFLIRGEKDWSLMQPLVDSFRSRLIGKSKLFDSDKIFLLNRQNARKYLNIELH